MAISNLDLCPSKIKHRELLKYTDEIIDLYTSRGHTLRQIGIKFNIDKGAIKRILIKNNVSIIDGNSRKTYLKCIDCKQEFLGRNGCSKRCENCNKIKDNSDAKERYRNRYAKHEVCDEVKCLKCRSTIPDARLGREYCDDCKRLRAYENKLRAWRKNPEHYRMKSREHQHNRRARKHGANCTHLDKKFLDILKQEFDMCVYCNRKTKLTIDHIVPLALDGDNSMSNLVLACKSCNSAKCDKRLLNFLWSRRNSLGVK